MPSRKLGTYEGKRDFEKTPEPAPRARGGTSAAPRRRRAADPALPRFVIHEHHARRLHWDLRLERDGALASWAVPKGMPDAPGENRFAAATEDHPIEYLDFHGEIPKGNYGAGKMTIWDQGTYEPLKWEPRKVEVLLHGERLNGRYALFPIDKEDPPKDWMIHRMDPPADAQREPMPQKIVPMMARIGELPSEDSAWAFEIKWDGVRAIAYSKPGELRLESRNLNDITDSYPELARLGRDLGSRSAVLDGEIVAFDDEGRPSFGALQQRMHVASREQARRLAKHTPVTYMIFDLLWLDGHTLMGLPYSERRQRLAELALAGESWQTPEHVVGQGEALLAASAQQRLEGIVAKRVDSTYEPGRRSRNWLKIKTTGRQEFVVGGWLPGKGKRAQSIGALLLGVYQPDGSLRYVGRVGSGFTERELERLQSLLAPLERDSSPFTAGERPPREARFVEPRLVVEVEFAEWTAGGNLRAPSYKGLREDKDASDVIREDVPRPGGRGRGAPGKATDGGKTGGGADGSGHPVSPAAASGEPAGGGLAIRERSAKGAVADVEGRELKLTNLDKVMYPETGFTKGDLIDYYVGVAPVLLPHLQGRALTVTRWPDGVEGKSFFQKQSPAHRPEWVRTVSLPAGSKTIDYTLCEDLPTLVWLANLAAIELHTPLARAPSVDRPTSIVFDLDPGEPANVIDCARVALRLQGMFENLGLSSFVKTSGSKGLQVYIPLNVDEVDFARTKTFAKAVAELFEQSEPERVIARQTKARRAGKVLIDWSQNDRNKTTVCVYSLRARPRPTVATPLDWGEVSTALKREDAELLTFEAPQVLGRAAERGDLFASVLSRTQSLPDFMPDS